MASSLLYVNAVEEGDNANSGVFNSFDTSSYDGRIGGDVFGYWEGGIDELILISDEIPQSRINEICI